MTEVILFYMKIIAIENLLEKRKNKLKLRELKLEMERRKQTQNRKNLFYLTSHKRMPSVLSLLSTLKRIKC